MEVCRLCLVVNVKMYNLVESPLVTYFREVFGVETLENSHLPQYACYECAMLLKKFFKFKQKSEQAEYVLFSILNTDGMITKNKIAMYNWNTQLQSNLSVQHNPPDSIIEIVHVENEPKLSVIEVKEETTPENTFDIMLTNLVKEEHDDSFHTRFSSDDDEPISMLKIDKNKIDKVKRKVNKLKKAKGKRGRKPKIKLEIPEDQPPEQLDNAEEIEEDSMRENRKTKKSNQECYSDLEEYCTVIKLSVDEQIEEIRSRQKTSNYLNATYQCNYCFKGFIDEDAWKHHAAKHDPTFGPVECQVCKLRYKDKRMLQKHLINHEKKFACKSCTHISKTATQAKQHQKWHKGHTYKCQYCDEVSNKWTSHLSHVRMKHPSEFICGSCGYSFVSKLGLAMHRSMMHKGRVEEVVSGPFCKECDVQFVSEEAYKRHMVTSTKHTKSNNFKNGCKVCGESFKTTDELKQHHRKTHAKKRPKNYGRKSEGNKWPSKCEHCGEEILDARRYWTHFRRVHPDKEYPIVKNYVCDICGKSFRGNAFLVYHKRTHFEERAYKCAQCPKAFFNRTNLQMHEKTHSELRPYPCTVCFKAFKCKGALDRHFRSHTGVKPYECEFCGKAFGQSNSRKLHVRTVHLKQPAPYISRTRLEKRKTQKEENSKMFFNVQPRF